MNSDDSLRLAPLRLSVGEQAPEELPDLAAGALARGLDSPSLRMLAGAPRDQYEDNRRLFVTAMHEFDLDAPLPDTAVRELVRYWAAEIIAGALSPYDGARRIWWRGWERKRRDKCACNYGSAPSSFVAA
ncbi:MAG TPA: hypothetical protein VE441_08235 [Mycobacterium sp.]|nr:hypothetical protein [Mycobacterium sp.]